MINESTTEVKATTSFESDVFNWIRSKFTKTKKSAHGFPRTYLVPVYMEHPEIPGHIHKQLVSIAAHDRKHARQRLAEELIIRIGTARKHIGK